MYAIVEIAGQQYKVEKDKNIFVHRLVGKEGSKIDFDKILLVDNDGKIIVGAPVVKNMVVSASIVNHLKGDKVKVFKKKRRKGYRVLNGHRQYLTEIHIDAIGEGKVRVKAESEKESDKKTEAKVEVKADTKTTSKPAAKVTEKVAAKPKTETKTEAKATKAKSTTEKTSASKSKAADKAEPKKVTKKAPAKKPASKAAPKTASKAKKPVDKKSGKS